MNEGVLYISLFALLKCKIHIVTKFIVF